MEHNSWLRRACDVIHVLASLATALTLFFAVFPQLQPRNTNYLQMANAGDLDAQMFLAEHYFEVGDIQESHYWYKLAAMSYGDHQGAALNNVAYIGLTYGYYNLSLQEYQSKALSMFKEAAARGDRTAVQNVYTLVKQLGEGNTTIDYEMELAWAIQVSARYGISLESVTESDIMWAYEQFQIDIESGYICEDGLVVYEGIGLFPYKDAFKEKEKTYKSYEYKIVNGS